MQILYMAVQLSDARYSQKNINVHSRMPASDHVFQYKVEIQYSQRKKDFQNCYSPKRNIFKYILVN